MPLLDTIQKDMAVAMKAKEEGRLGALRMIKTALQKHQIDSMKPLDENAEMQVMTMLLKQRREAADLFRKGEREELAVKEEAEARIIESYLPSAPSAAELEQAVAAAIAELGANSQKQMGAVMKAAQAKLAGKRVDGKALSELVKSDSWPRRGFSIDLNNFDSLRERCQRIAGGRVLVRNHTAEIQIRDRLRHKSIVQLLRLIDFVAPRYFRRYENEPRYWKLSRIVRMMSPSMICM